MQMKLMRVCMYVGLFALLALDAHVEVHIFSRYQESLMKL